MLTAVPLACFLSMISPPGVQFEKALLQLAPVDKSKCPMMKDSRDIQFQLFTKYNPTVYQELVIGDDDKLFASSIDFRAPTVIYFHAFMELPDENSGMLVREAYMLRGDTNVIMVDASKLEAGPWYFTAADNTWYIGRFAAKFIDYLVSRGLDLSKTHLIGHSLGAQSAGVAGGALITGRVSRITGLDPALPLFANLPLGQRLDPGDADFVDVIHTDAGIFGVNTPTGHADFYPNGGISPQPGCELEVVIPQQLLLNKCDSNKKLQGYYQFDLKAKHVKKRSKTHKNSTQHIRDKKQYQHINTEPTFHSKKRQNTKQHKIKSKNFPLYRTKTSDIAKNSTETLPVRNDTKAETIQTDSKHPNVAKPYHWIFNTTPTTPGKEKDTSDKSEPQATTSNSDFNSIKTVLDETFPDVTLDAGTSHVKKRQKRFLPFLKRSEGAESDNFFFKILEFVNRNRKNVLPVFTVMREINTLVKSANGELNHSSKERNNYIGHNPPVLPLATYNLELGSDSKVKAFVKRLLGLKVEGDRLTIAGK